jgi:hypothetical protein
VIVPFSNKVSANSYQFYNLDMFVDKEEHLTINKARMHEFYYSNTPTNKDEKVIQKL